MQETSRAMERYYEGAEEGGAEANRRRHEGLRSLGAADPAERDESIQWTPELTLMLAILEDAVACYRKTLKRPRQNPEILARQAEFWMRLDDWDSPFSFNNICEALKMEPVATRQSILGSSPADARRS